MGATPKLAVVVVLVGILGASRPADAKKIPIIYQTGQDTFESGPLPAPYDKEPALAGAFAGYVCDVTGVFWSYFSISNCRAAAIRGNQFDDSAELAAAVKKLYPEPTIPFWADHGWKLMIGGVGALVLAGFLFGRRKKSDQPRIRDSVPPKTQFHMAVNVEGLADDRRAAFERSAPPPGVTPSAAPHVPPIPTAPGVPPPPAQAYAPQSPSYGAVAEPATTQYPPNFNPQQYASPFAPPHPRVVPQPPPAPAMMVPPVQRPATPQHTQIGYIVQPPRAGVTPAPVLVQPPTVAVAPHAYNPVALTEDGPTIMDPRTQANAEQWYEQQRRAARGSNTPQPYAQQPYAQQPYAPPTQPQPQVQVYDPSEEPPTTPVQSHALRAAQLPSTSWDSRAPTVVARPRNK